MKKRTFDYIVSIIRETIQEEAPTVSASHGQISGVSSGATPPNVNDLPPVDLRKKNYKKLSIFYKDLFRRGIGGVQTKRKR